MSDPDAAAEPETQNVALLSRSTELLEGTQQARFGRDSFEFRRQTILASLELAGSKVVGRLWKQLTREEKLDKEIMYKILSTGTGRFGVRPWDVKGGPQLKLPHKFRSDPDAVLAFLSNSDPGYFEPPESLKDDKQIMMAICAKNPFRLRFASPRLRDDEDFVRTVLFKKDRFCFSALEHASDRLRKDKRLVMDLIDLAASEGCFDYRWLEHVKLDVDEVMALKVLGHANKLATQRDLRLWEVEIFLKGLSASVRDSKELMFQFVKLDWRLLEHCSERLRSDEAVVKEAVSQTVEAYKYALGPVRHKYMEGRTLSIVLKEIESGACFEIPESMKTNKKVLMARLKAGKVSATEYRHLPESMRSDKSIVIAFAKGFPDPSSDKYNSSKFREFDEYESIDEEVYCSLPNHMQTDKEIALALLKAGYEPYEHIFEKIPSLCSCREAMMAIAKIYRPTHRHFEKLVRRCEFRDDEKFMMAAYEIVPDTMRYASERLLSNRDFIEAALELGTCDGKFIASSTPEFQVSNIDLVIKAIRKEPVIRNCLDLCRIFENLNPEVWRQRPAVMAWLKKGKPVLKGLASLDPENPLLSDIEVVLLAGTIRPADLKYASASLHRDRASILSLVRGNGRLLAYAATKEFKRDDEILVAAISQNGAAIVDCFDILKSEADFDFLSQFAVRVRSKLEDHDTFVNEFLRGISICNQSGIPPAKRCNLPLLDRGLETSTSFKRLIAEYAGAPMGEEFLQLRATSLMLGKFGF